MSEPVSLSATGPPQVTPPSVSFPLERYGRPVPNKKDVCIIEGVEVGPETILGSGEDQTKRERRVSVKYLALTKGLICQYDMQPLTVKLDTGLPATDVHHFVRLSNGKRLHQMKHMALVCHDHNALLGEPLLAVVSQAGERERTRQAHTQSQQEPHGEWTSEEGQRSDKMTYRYRQKVFHPETGLKTEDVRELKKFADELEEELDVGKAQTYERYLRKDVRVGYFELFDEDGVDKIKRTAKAYPLERLGITTA